MKPSEALSRLQGECAAAETCSAEARKRLDKWGITAPKQELIIRLLKRDKFIDDQRYALTYALSKLLYSNWGRYKIRQGLYGKEIPKPLIDKAIESLDPEEYEEAALRTIRVKQSQLRDSAHTREGREKILRFAASRGFELGLIAELLDRDRG